MPVVIGGKPQSGFTDPIGLLTDCHRRIERFLAVLEQVSAQARGGPLDSEQRAALETALRYFRDAAPKHTADEEQTLFPRLRSLENAEARAVLAKVEALETQHTEADRRHAEVDRLGRAWLEGGTLAGPDAERLASLLAELSEMYRGHISLEEEEVFPAAASSLGDAERRAMGREMAARRGLAGPAESSTEQPA
jgi:hemerythrin-like domain-containing protein